MSDQFPPPAQPSQPTPGGPGGPGAGPAGGSTPPPPPPTEGYGAQGGSTPPPPPPAPARKSRKKLVIGIVAAIVALALVAGGAVFAVVALTGPDKHTLTITKTAGGMKRATEVETQLAPQVEAAEKQFAKQLKSKSLKVEYVRSGVYAQDDSKRGPKGVLVFLGGKVDGQQDPVKRLAAFRKLAEKNGFKSSKVAAGDQGGEAACAYQTTGQKIAICAWATNDTMGELVPTVPGYDAKQLSKLLLDVREDVESTD